jgi:hypothetical protein
MPWPIQLSVVLSPCGQNYPGGFVTVKEGTARELYERWKTSCEMLSKATKVDISPDEMFKFGMMLVDVVKPQLAVPVPARVKKAAKKAAKKGFLNAVRAIPEPTNDEKARLLEVFGSLPFVLRQAFVQVGKTMPHKPGGAPPKFKTPAKRKEAAEDVARLLSVGVEKPDALSQIAARYKVSDRTIRRVWAEYAKANTRSLTTT